MVLGELQKPEPFSGTGHMQVTIRPGFQFVVRFIRCHFVRLSGSGTSVANFTVTLDSDFGATFDNLLETFASAGVGADLRANFANETIEAWAFWDGDGLTFNWTNPDPGEISWGLTVGLQQWR